MIKRYISAGFHSNFAQRSQLLQAVFIRIGILFRFICLMTLYRKFPAKKSKKGEIRYEKVL